jgi:archaemetzincin
MSRRLKLLIVALVAVNGLLAAAWLLRPRTLDDRSRELRAEVLEPRFERLKPLETPWRSPDLDRSVRRGEEPGATFAEYVAWAPARPAKGKGAVDLVLLGEFTPSERKLVGLSAEFLRSASGLEVRLHEPQPLPDVPKRTQGGKVQVLSGALAKTLVSKVPADSLGMMAVLAIGLYPGEKWNFVFWDGSEDRVTAGSIQGFGDLDASPEEFRRALTRTLKAQTQQLLALLSIAGCAGYECLDNPSDGLDDLDRQPLHLCPSCLQKLCWNVGCNPARTLAATAGFLRENGLVDPWYERALPLLGKP